MGGLQACSLQSPPAIGSAAHCDVQRRGALLCGQGCISTLWPFCELLAAASAWRHSARGKVRHLHESRVMSHEEQGQHPDYRQFRSITI